MKRHRQSLLTAFRPKNAERQKAEVNVSVVEEEDITDAPDSLRRGPALKRRKTSVTRMGHSMAPTGEENHKRARKRKVALSSTLARGGQQSSLESFVRRLQAPKKTSEALDVDEKSISDTEVVEREDTVVVGDITPVRSDPESKRFKQVGLEGHAGWFKWSEQKAKSLRQVSGNTGRIQSSRSSLVTNLMLKEIQGILPLVGDRETERLVYARASVTDLVDEPEMNEAEKEMERRNRLNEGELVEEGGQSRQRSATAVRSSAFHSTGMGLRLEMSHSLRFMQLDQSKRIVSHSKEAARLPGRGELSYGLVGQSKALTTHELGIGLGVHTPVVQQQFDREGYLLASSFGDGNIVVHDVDSFLETLASRTRLLEEESASAAKSTGRGHVESSSGFEDHYHERGKIRHWTTKTDAMDGRSRQCLFKEPTVYLPQPTLHFIPSGRRAVESMVWSGSECTEMLLGYRSHCNIDLFDLLRCTPAQSTYAVSAGDAKPLRSLKPHRVSVELEGRGFGYWQVALAPDAGTGVWALGRDDRMRLWDIRHHVTPQIETKLVEGAGAMCFQVSQCGRHVWVGTRQGTLNCYDRRKLGSSPLQVVGVANCLMRSGWTNRPIRQPAITAVKFLDGDSRWAAVTLGGTATAVLDVTLDRNELLASYLPVKLDGKPAAAHKGFEVIPAGMASTSGAHLPGRTRLPLLCLPARGKSAVTFIDVWGRLVQSIDVVTPYEVSSLSAHPTRPDIVACGFRGAKQPTVGILGPH